MNPLRSQRLLLVIFVVLGSSAALAVTLAALKENVNAFYPPAQMLDGSAPTAVRIRAGGMVKAGSVQRARDSLHISFVLTDYAGSEFTVDYVGILPDMFREGQGVMTTGELGTDGRFKAQEVLAKHDENYHPPELAGMPKSVVAQGAGAAAVGTDGNSGSAGQLGTATTLRTLPQGSAATAAAAATTRAAQSRTREPESRIP